MKTRIKVKNFRCFDIDGAELRVEPITILTGGNGAGKSSFAKAITLLNQLI